MAKGRLFSDMTAMFLTDTFNFQSKYLSLIAFALTFIGIVIGIHFLARALDKLIKAVALGIVNRIAGLLFAILRTAFLISVVLVIINSIDSRAPFIPEEHKENSLLYKPLSNLAPAIFPYLNFEEIRERMPRTEKPELEA